MEIEYKAIYEYLHCGKYPAGSTVNQKRATRNKAKKFVIKDGVLHYIAKDTFLCRFPVPPSDDHL